MLSRVGLRFGSSVREVGVGRLFACCERTAAADRNINMDAVDRSSTRAGCCAEGTFVRCAR